jgi:hypothetical protein
MYLSVHAPAGVLLAQSTESAPLAFLMGIFSHFLLDIVPHGDTHIDEWANKKYPQRLLMVAAMDFVFMLIVLYFMLGNINFNPSVTAAGILGATLPDFIWGLKIFIKKNRLLQAYIRSHKNWHTILPDIISFKQGLLFQALTLAGILLWSFIYF